MCSSCLPQWLSGVLGLPAVLRKNRNLPSQGHKAITGIRKKLPLLAYYCRLYICKYPFLASLWAERTLTHWFASSSHHQAALGVLSPVWGEGRAGPRCPQLLSHSPAPVTLPGGVHTMPLLSFLCGSSPVIFYQYSSKSFKINESSDLQIFSLSETSIKYLPVCNEKSQTIHPFDLLLLS